MARGDIPILTPFMFLWVLLERAFDFGPHADLMRTIKKDTRELEENRERRQAAMAQAVANRDRQAMRDLRKTTRRSRKHD